MKSLTNKTQNKLAKEVNEGNSNLKEALLVSFFPLADHVHREISEDVDSETVLEESELREITEVALDKSLEGYQNKEKDYNIGTFMAWHLRDLIRDRLG